MTSVNASVELSSFANISLPVHQKVLTVMASIDRACEVYFQSKNIKSTVVTFGGYIRDTIAGKIQTIDSIVDIDTWILLSKRPGYTSLSLNGAKLFFIALTESLKENHTVACNVMALDDQPNDTPNYGVLKMLIDGIRFDIGTDINYNFSFAKLSDYTVNNLYMNLSGKINLRVPSQHGIGECICDIFERQLIRVIDPHASQTKWSRSNLPDLSGPCEQREAKMIAKGYHF